MTLISRARRFVKQPAGYTAFVPAPLTPDPPIQMDVPMIGLLSRADQAVGRLDGVARTLPNPNLFVAMYVRREAVLSSQIEGIQSTLLGNVNLVQEILDVKAFTTANKLVERFEALGLLQ